MNNYFIYLVVIEKFHPPSDLKVNDYPIKGLEPVSLNGI